MERSAAAVAPTTPSEFVRWEEVYVSSGHGKRQVHYFLKRRDGTADLAVLGKEKSLGRMSYRYSSACRSILQMSPSAHLSKLRSRSEVVNWLNSVVLGSSPRGSGDVVSKTSLDRINRFSLDGKTFKDIHSLKLGRPTSAFLWVGSPWTCRKKRRHYEAYQKNGVKISVHDFVYVLAEEAKRLVAYLEDLYEDSKGNKMVVVRWFHKIDEVGISFPRNYSDREVFFSLCLQDLSIECIDGLATVLAPQHYEKYLKDAKGGPLQPFVCCSQFDNDEIKPFDVSQVKDYWRQELLSHTCPSLALRDDNLKPQPLSSSPHSERSISDDDPVRPKKRLRKLKERNVSPRPANKKVPFSPCLNVLDLTIGSKIELLSQDSGLRGCWFRALIIKKHKDKIKVKYEDIKDADDEANNLEEWVPASRVANQDPAGLRMCGRKTVRPVPPSGKDVSSAVKIGDVVDARWHNGWWEGIVIQIVPEDKIHVYFPGEKIESVFDSCDVRHSQEWLGNRWEHIKARPDVATLILRDLELKENIGITSAVEEPKKPGSGKLVIVIPREDSPGKDEVRKKIVRDLAKDSLLAQLRWRRLGKRRRSGISSNVRSPEAVDTGKIRRLLVSTVDHDNCKYVGDSPFSSSVVPPLTNLVMSM